MSESRDQWEQLSRERDDVVQQLGRVKDVLTSEKQLRLDVSTVYFFFTIITADVIIRVVVVVAVVLVVLLQRLYNSEKSFVSENMPNRITLFTLQHHFQYASVFSNTCQIVNTYPVGLLLSASCIIYNVYIYIRTVHLSKQIAGQEFNFN